MQQCSGLDLKVLDFHSLWVFLRIFCYWFLIWSSQQTNFSAYGLLSKEICNGGVARIGGGWQATPSTTKFLTAESLSSQSFAVRMYENGQGHLTLFCIVFVWLRGRPSPVRIMTQDPWFMYQNQLGPSGGIYHPNFVPCFVVLYLNRNHGTFQNNKEKNQFNDLR